MKEIKLRVGDLLDVTEGIIVHGCNAQGVMGSGVAKQIKEKYPKAYDEYRFDYGNHGLRLGDCVTTDIDTDLIIVNAVTQNSFGRSYMRYVNYEAIANTFEFLRRLAKQKNKKIHFPMIGAGLANGNWNIIKTIIEETCPDVEKYLWVRDLEEYIKWENPIIPTKYIGEFKLEGNPEEYISCDIKQLEITSHEVKN